MTFRNSVPRDKFRSGTRNSTILLHSRVLGIIRLRQKKIRGTPEGKGRTDCQREATRRRLCAAVVFLKRSLPESAAIRRGKASIVAYPHRLRDELLNEALFTTPAQAQVLLRRWRANYIDARPHCGLDWQTPPISPAPSRVVTRRGIALTPRSRTSLTASSLNCLLKSRRTIRCLRYHHDTQSRCPCTGMSMPLEISPKSAEVKFPSSAAQEAVVLKRFWAAARVGAAPVSGRAA